MSTVYENTFALQHCWSNGSYMQFYVNGEWPSKWRGVGAACKVLSSFRLDLEAIRGEKQKCFGKHHSFD